MEGVQIHDPDHVDAPDLDADGPAGRGDGPMPLPVAEAIVWALLDAGCLVAAKRICTCVSMRVFSGIFMMRAFSMPRKRTFFMCWLM